MRVLIKDEAIPAMIELPENLTLHPESGLGGTESTDLLSQVPAQIRPTGDRAYFAALASR
jgi:hypothetical protein